jgi:hypothetical protein
VGFLQAAPVFSQPLEILRTPFSYLATNSYVCKRQRADSSFAIRPLGSLGKQKDYWPDAAAVVAALAICLSV